MAAKKVKIELDTEEAEIHFTTGGNDLMLARVADAAGNRTKDLSGFINIEPAGNIGLDADAGVKATAVDKIVLTLDDVLVEFDDDDFVIYAGTTANALDVKSVKEDSSGNKTVITFTLVDELDYEGTFEGATVYIATVDQDDVDSVNEYGAKVLLNDTVEDGISPELIDSTTEDAITITTPGTITIKFTENVESEAGNALAATDFVIVDPDGKTLKAGVGYYVDSISTNVVTIILVDPEVGEYTIKTIDAPKYIQDLEGNKIAKIKATDLELE